MLCTEVCRNINIINIWLLVYKPIYVVELHKIRFVKADQDTIKQKIHSLASIIFESLLNVKEMGWNVLLLICFIV